MELIGYTAAILIGISLGLIGGGGSILTVPILVYFFHIDPVIAGTYSLVVVGITSAVGSLSHYYKGNVNFKTVFVFGIPSLTAIFLMRKFVMPAIPFVVFKLGIHSITKPFLLMVCFAILMVAASISMIGKRNLQGDFFQEVGVQPNYYWLFVFGILIGIITGFVGVGGGFLIIPALVIVAGMPMKKAVGTSLMIMTLSSLIGVTGDLFSNQPIHYVFILIFSGFAVFGIIGGTYLGKYISNERLKPAFGWFVLAMGIFIFINTLTHQF